MKCYPSSKKIPTLSIISSSLESTPMRDNFKTTVNIPRTLVVIALSIFIMEMDMKDDAKVTCVLYCIVLYYTAPSLGRYKAGEKLDRSVGKLTARLEWYSLC